VTRRVVPLQLGSVALVAIEGVVGIWLSVEWNVPPGAAIAVLSGAVFAAVALLVALRQRQLLLLPGLAALLVVAAGCGGSGTARGETGGVDVVATTTQIGDWTRQVAGSLGHVRQLLQPNTDPHDYEPRPSDVVETGDADVVLLNGDELDHWMGQVTEAAGGDPAIVDLGERAPVKLAGRSEGPEATRYDPHWWHDPRNARTAVVAIRDALTRANPGARAAYARNAAAYLAKLRVLDHGIADCIGTVAPAARKLVTDHDAFGYFARRYGITVIGAVIPSQSTQAQPSAGDVADLTRLIRREGVKAVFPESSINPKLAEAIASQTGATSDYELYGDTLGPKGSGGATYLSMERANADAMVRGFTAGARGCPIAGI
jgi:ABC-type Zn uptake system ZnuABC Zn-binding protein ZnuA